MNPPNPPRRKAQGFYTCRTISPWESKKVRRRAAVIAVGTATIAFFAFICYEAWALRNQEPEAEPAFAVNETTEVQPDVLVRHGTSRTRELSKVFTPEPHSNLDAQR